MSTIETQDGHVTALFQEKTDDAALAAAVPGLIVKGVQAISLRGLPIHDIRPLSTMTGLQSLDLRGTLVRDLTPLSALTNLRSLNIQFVRVKDLSSIAGLIALRALNAGGTDVTTLAALANLREMTNLVLTVTEVRDFRPLIQLRDLETLDANSTWVSNLRPLADMARLHTLRLNGAPVDDVEPLAPLSALRELDLGGTPVSDLSPLSRLCSLQTLNLEGTQVSDVSPLSALPALRRVAVGGAPAKDMRPLARLVAVPAVERPSDQVGLDPPLYSSDQTNKASEATSTDAFEASRALALESIAVMDTLRSIEGSPAFLVRLAPPPAAQTTLDSALAMALSQGPGRDASMRVGAAIADGVFMRRDGARWNQASVVHSGHLPDQWRPTPPRLQPPAHTRMGVDGAVRNDQPGPIPAVGAASSGFSRLGPKSNRAARPNQPPAPRTRPKSPITGVT